MTYSEFKELYKEPKYFGMKCFISGCNKKAEYEGGDSPFYHAVCEEHSNILSLWKSQKEIKDGKGAEVDIKF